MADQGELFNRGPARRRPRKNAGSNAPVLEREYLDILITEASVTYVATGFIRDLIMADSHDVMQTLLADSKHLKRASERIPILARHAVSDRAKKTLDAVSSMQDLLHCFTITSFFSINCLS